MQAALEAEWPYVDELFDPTYVDRALLDGGVAVDPSGLRKAFEQRVAEVVGEATLQLPEVAPATTGGRRGEHTADLLELLGDLQSLARAHPGATW
jgi:ring-1,2-phenylacetyl-CoA epoxidase subunit PaaC